MKYSLQAPLGAALKYLFSPVFFSPSAFCARAFLACLLLSGSSCFRLLGKRLIQCHLSLLSLSASAEDFNEEHQHRLFA